MNVNDCVVLKVTLEETDIWRRFVVPKEATLDWFHEFLQVVMGWGNCHLYQFHHKKKLISLPDDWSMSETIHPKDITVGEIFLRKGSKLRYEYDFGDCWLHEIVSEGKASKDQQAFQILDWKMACPPEDAGGVWGYEQKLEVLRNPMDDDHEDILDWIGLDFDRKKFDVKSAQERIDRYCKKFFLKKI